jgi:hypothetical protein
MKGIVRRKDRIGTIDPSKSCHYQPPYPFFPNEQRFTQNALIRQQNPSTGTLSVNENVHKLEVGVLLPQDMTSDICEPTEGFQNRQSSSSFFR